MNVNLGHLVPLVLASGSPRRVELMEEAGYVFEVLVPEVEEAHDESLTCEALTMENARLKGRVIAASRPDAVVVAADTLVYLDDKPLGKPRDMEDAAAMLRRLSGRTHRVCTGVAVLAKGGTVSMPSQSSVRSPSSFSRRRSFASITRRSSRSTRRVPMPCRMRAHDHRAGRRLLVQCQRPPHGAPAG
ncbi:Maf family protein [Verrucomicrobium spinosum]|uniref:Maf family protein n=1 Tax=Verrucomicrobium spinosum TaxID=2736 RepID=UPI0009EC0299|nr:Maf family protein [Verrucomicrobium spinosum]